MEAAVLLPNPLTPIDCDLSDFKFMPLLISRLRRSKAWLMAKRQPELGFYMMNLWAVAWHEIPAASLEDDDDVLCDLAMCDPQRWGDVKAKVLHGWVKCTDGRLYHTVVAEQANEAWSARQSYRERLSKARAAKAQRLSQGNDTNKTVSIIEQPQVSDTPIVGHKETVDSRQETVQEEEQATLVCAKPVLDAWNAMAEAGSLPIVRRLTGSRAKHLMARIRENGVPDLLEAIERIAHSRFCHGAGGQAWRAEFNWFLRPDTCAQVLEGKYDDRKPANGSLDWQAPSGDYQSTPVAGF